MCFNTGFWCAAIMIRNQSWETFATQPQEQQYSACTKLAKHVKEDFSIFFASYKVKKKNVMLSVSGSNSTGNSLDQDLNLPSLFNLI